MTIAFDARDGTNTTNDTQSVSYTHTPVGTPRGVIVGVAMEDHAGGQASSVTYGGVSMSQVSGSPYAVTDMGMVQMWFLGSGVPTGAQSVAVTMDTATPEDFSVFSITVTADDDVEVQATATASDPNVTLWQPTFDAGTESAFIALIGYSGRDRTARVSELTGWSDNSGEEDLGSNTVVMYWREALSSGTTTYGFENNAADEAQALVVALIESTGSSGISSPVEISTESNTSTLVSAQKAASLSVNSESNLALSIITGLSNALSIPTETDQSLSLDALKTREFQIVSETDTAAALSLEAGVQLLTVSESNTSNSTGVLKYKQVEAASSTNQAYSIDVLEASITELGLSTETNSVTEILKIKSQSLSTVFETNTALDINLTGSIQPVSETTITFPIEAAQKSQSLSLTTETNLTFGVNVAKFNTLNTATESNVSSDISEMLIRFVNTVTESDLARRISGAGGPEAGLYSNSLDWVAAALDRQGGWNDLWMAYLASEGRDNGSLNDRLLAWLGDQGHAGALSDRISSWERANLKPHV